MTATLDNLIATLPDLTGAACARADEPTCWDEEVDGRGPIETLRQHNHARAVCADCPVRLTCLQWGLQNAAEELGIIGGLTRDERRHMLGLKIPGADVVRCGTKSARGRHRKHGELCQICEGAHIQRREDSLARFRNIHKRWSL